MFRVVVADVVNSFTDYGGNIRIALGGDFTHYNHHAGGSYALAGNTGIFVLSEYCVQYRIGNLVTHFIRVSLSNGFGGEHSVCHWFVHFFIYLALDNDSVI